MIHHTTRRFTNVFSQSQPLAPHKPLICGWQDCEYTHAATAAQSTEVAKEVGCGGKTSSAQPRAMKQRSQSRVLSSSSTSPRRLIERVSPFLGNKLQENVLEHGVSPNAVSVDWLLVPRLTPAMGAVWQGMELTLAPAWPQSCGQVMNRGGDREGERCM